MTFRFISHFAADPYFNMAFDEWMFDKVISTPDMFILRLYSWSPGAITFGLNQRIEKAYNHKQVGETPVIRRATGGRAIFHDESELTYGLAIGAEVLESQKIGKSISESSLLISTLLVDTLKKFGIESAVTRQSIDEEKSKDFFHSAPCFESVAKYEIMTNQHKIIASAQRRAAGSVLQHGSIKINGFKSHPALLLKDTNVLIDNKIEKVQSPQFQRFAKLLKGSFENYFSSPLELLELSESEKTAINNKLIYVRNNCLEKRDSIKQN
ncbi:MAG: hypothetical protein DWP97_04595 [Calditrichaeota bacterium]|nr:MAG: hypothetical protein DWP97_04595 [Calditrichota bacterium]